MSGPVYQRVEVPSGSASDTLSLSKVRGAKASSAVCVDLIVRLPLAGSEEDNFNEKKSMETAVLKTDFICILYENTIFGSFKIN